MPLIDIRHCSITIDTPQGKVRAVERMSLTINEGEIRGLVGESGSGKSLIAKAIVGLTKDTWTVTADRMRYGDIDLLQLNKKERRKLIAKEIGMIFQEPSSCLDPSEKVGEQLSESIPKSAYSGPWYKRIAWRSKLSHALLHKVGIKDHKRIMQSYPYELTDGECQKVMIAMAIAAGPRLLIADEPTNDLDSVTQAQILRLLSRMNQLQRTTILLIGHDLSTIAQWSDRLTVMYCGQSVESGSTNKVLEGPKHPYTAALIKSMPDFVSSDQHKQRLSSLPGSIPPLQHLPIGCRLGPRCPYARKECVEAPLSKKVKGHKYSCHFPLNTKSSDSSKSQGGKSNGEQSHRNKSNRNKPQSSKVTA